MKIHSVRNRKYANATAVCLIAGNGEKVWFALKHGPTADNPADVFSVVVPSLIPHLIAVDMFGEFLNVPYIKEGF